MPRFVLFDLVKWLHFICVALAGGGAVVALLISGLEDDREDLRGLSAALWRKVVAHGVRLAVVTGGILVTMQVERGGHLFDAYFLPLNSIFVCLLLVMSELSAKALARAKRGAPLMALLCFLLASFVAVNRSAFGRKLPPPPELSAGPAE